MPKLFSPALILLLCACVTFLSDRTATALTAATITVNTTADDQINNGNCTLREAILAANTNTPVDACGGGMASDETPDNIVFALGAGTPRINITINNQLLNPLPAINEPVFINGNTGGSTRIELNGAGNIGLVINAANARIRGLVIGGFSTGIEINRPNAVIENCFIGTDATGTEKRPQFIGLLVNSTGNRIGGLNASLRNVISGNAYGIYLASDASSNQIVNNYVGVNAMGTAALGNGAGIAVYSASNIIGGTNEAARNVISGNSNGGIILGGRPLNDQSPNANDNRISGNFIGTNAAGTAAVGNGASGIVLFNNASRNTIGSVLAGGRNIVAGNGFSTDTNEAYGDSGIRSQRQLGVAGPASGSAGAENNILGNYIGLDVTGKVKLGNKGDGIYLSNSRNQTIGGTQAGARNVISGNGGSGIYLVGNDSSDTTIIGNYIGVDESGKVALGNGRNGIAVNQTSAVIGGTALGTGNLVSGNEQTGIGVDGAARIQGNYVGTDATGNTSLGNGVGVTLSGDGVIGGSEPSARNVISGNRFQGVAVRASVSIDVWGNYIGLGADGSTAVGNRDGILVIGTNNRVGGLSAGQVNVIAHNRGNGVVVSASGSALSSNPVLSNSIFANGELGIDLDGNGVTPNDAGDTDTGSNQLQNFPELSCAVSANGQTTIQGRLRSMSGGAQYRLQFFVNPTCDASGYGEGQTLIGQTLVTGDAGTAGFVVTFPVNITPGQFITATATDPGGSTSEFSACVAVARPQLAINDVTVDEGNEGTVNAVFTVTLTGAQNFCLPITVNYATANATAVAPDDFIATSGTLTFNPPFTSAPMTQTIIVTVKADRNEEIIETFTVNLNNPVNAEITKAQGTGSIIDDDSRFQVIGPPVPDASALGDGRPGSVLIFPLYTSLITTLGAQNTRIQLTNADALAPVTIHLFFINGASGAAADTIICLTVNQTVSLLASDLDPGVTGFVLAVAINRAGCPVKFNSLLGEASVKFTSGHAAHLPATAVAAINAPSCAPGTTAAQLAFDGLSYNALPRTVAASSLYARPDGNDTLLVLDRIGGSLTSGAASLGAISGALFNDTESGFSFMFTVGAPQFIGPFNNSFPRTSTRFEQVIPAGRTGWLKLWLGEDGALVGATINRNLSLRAAPHAFNQGHNLHYLTLTGSAKLTMPITAVSCN